MKIEPNADMRQWAVMVRQAHEALIDEGFSRDEASILVGQLIRATGVRR